MKDQMKQLQAENADLRAEVDRLRCEVEQGNNVDDSNATMIPASQQNTCAIELKGLQQLLKEVQRLKADLKGRDERLAELEHENEDLAERLRQAEAASSAVRFQPGTPVQYYSGSLNRWIDAVVEAFHSGKYDLDVKKS